MSQGARPGGKLNVFISYSRDDLDFSDQLDKALELTGFSTIIDRHGISGGEDWKSRLSNLIHDADTVVFVLSPSSARSEVCAWEVEEASSLGKRILPVVCRSLDGVPPPERLSALNYIFFYAEAKSPGSGFGAGLARLVSALNTDLDWLREHTRLLQRAGEWNVGGRTVNRLLSGPDVAAAKEWASRRPKDAPAPTTLHLDYIRASEEEEAARSNAERLQLEDRRKALEQTEKAQEDRAIALRKLSRRTRYGLFGLSGLAAISVVAAIVAYVQSHALQAASLRLREGMKLKIARTDHSVLATEKWYRIATDYKLAIGVYRANIANSDQFGTGFLVKGESLRADWRNRVVFVTASHNIRSHLLADEPGIDPDISKAYIVFPGLDAGLQVRIEKLLFESKPDGLDVAVLSLSGGLPRYAVPVDLAGQIEAKEALGGVAVLHWTGQDGFTIGFGHGTENSDSDTSIAANRMYYTHITGPGASGAPIFDASSGNVVCLHVGSDPRPPRPVGFCTSITQIVSAIAAR